MKPKFKRVADDHVPVDLSTWGLPKADAITDQWQEAVRTAAAEALEYAMENAASAYFPIEWAPDGDGWNGPAVIDPAILYIGVPLGPDDIEEPHWTVSLTEIVQDYISSVRSGKAQAIESEDDRRNMKALADMFRSQAERIEAALAVKG